MLVLKAYRTLPEQALKLEAGAARAFTVLQGQFLTIADVEGQQVGSFFAFNPSDRHEYLSPHNTRLMCEGFVPGVGARFISNRRRTMLVLVRDTVGRHDLVLPACDAALFASHGATKHRNCHDNALEALRTIGVTVPRLYDPVNLFMNVQLDADKRLSIAPPVSRPGDQLTFRATMDSLCVLSACPMDLDHRNGGRLTGLSVRVHNEP
jgi:uncharacterized protein YcgI (DUF1989 family)